MRFNPAPLLSTATALNAVVAPKAGSPALAPSAHPVSVESVAQLNAHAANVTAQLAHAAALAARASATYVVSAYELAEADLHNSAKVGAALDAFKAQMSSFDLSSIINGTSLAVPAAAAAAPSLGAAPPIPPHPPEPSTVPHPPDPQAVPGPAEAAAAALQSGDQGASLKAMATTWRAIATELRGHHSSLTDAAGGLESGWQGDSSARAVARLRPFAQWFGEEGAQLAESVAVHAEKLYDAHSSAVKEHPTLEDLTQLRQNFNDAVARANSGNLAAAKEALDYRQELSKAQTTSGQVVKSYAGNAAIPMSNPKPIPSPVTPGPQREAKGDKPKDGRGEPIKPEDPKDKPTGSGEDAGIDHTRLNEFKPHDKADPAASGKAAAATPPGQEAAMPKPRAVDTSAPGMDDAAAAAPPTAMMSPLSQAMSQGGQMGGGSPQSPSAPSMPQMPQQSPPISPMPQQSPPQGGGNPSPQNPAVSPSGAGGAPSIPPIGGGAGGGAGGGGAAGGGAASMGAMAPATALSQNSGATGPPGPTTGVTAGLPMGGGMMPHGASGGGSGKQSERDPDLAPDTPVYYEDRDHTPAFIDGSIGPPAPPEIKEQQQ